MEYKVTWITKNLAMGPAPMSYAQLDIIRENGINAIVNLCAEFSDLHEIEEKAGFEVCYLPIWDEDVPDLPAMETALAWLDEAIYLDKKILVHCRHGIGRTGTFVTAYMIRRGLGLRRASKKLKFSGANPSTYGQWKLVKKYNKQSGELKIREPSLELKNRVDLGRFFSDYDALIQRVDLEVNAHGRADDQPCGRGLHPCCSAPFDIQFIEVVYIHSRMGRQLTSAQREDAIHRAVATKKSKTTRCPFNQGEGCEIFDFRPERCRSYGAEHFERDRAEIDSMMFELSRELFLALTGQFLERGQFCFSLADTVSGKFVQSYFNHMQGLRM